MKRVGIIALVMLALGAGATTAQASAKWPAHCRNFKCVNAHLNALQTQVTALKAKVKHYQLVDYLFQCGAEFPESVDSSGYFFLTSSGSTPDVWALGDGCNTDPAAARRATRRMPSITPLAFFAMQ